MKKKIASMKKVFLPVFLFAALLFSSCSKSELDDLQVSNSENGKSGAATTAKIGDQTPTIPATSMISITYGTCMGACPNFTVTLNREGDVVYNGIANVATLGAVHFKISADKAYQLGFMMVQEGFFHLENEYALIPDAQRFETSLVWDGKIKSVVDYGIHVPYNLLSMRERVIEALNIRRLISGGSEQIEVSQIAK